MFMCVYGSKSQKQIQTYGFVVILGFGRVEAVVMLSGQAGEQRMHQTPKNPKIQKKTICLCVFLIFGTQKYKYVHVCLWFSGHPNLYIGMVLDSLRRTCGDEEVGGGSINGFKY